MAIWMRIKKIDLDLIEEILISKDKFGFDCGNHELLFEWEEKKSKENKDLIEKILISKNKFGFDCENPELWVPNFGLKLSDMIHIIV